MKIKPAVADMLVTESVQIAWGIRETDGWVFFGNINEFIYLDPTMTLNEVELFAKAALDRPLKRELTDEQYRGGYTYCEIQRINQEFVPRDEALKTTPFLQNLADAKKKVDELEEEYRKNIKSEKR